MSIIRCRYGDFSMPDRSDLIIDAMRKYGEWGQHEIDIFSHLIHPGGIVVDVGAFIGTHTRAFSDMVGPAGKVYAFEPNPVSHELLLENISLAQYKNISPYQEALGQRSAFGSIVLDQTHENMGGAKLTEGQIESVNTTAFIRRLDEFDFRGIDLIKVDIEGMEYPMLLGAEKTIARCRPIIFLEANSLQATHLILSWASEFDYVVLGVICDAFNPHNFNGLADNMFGDAKECGLLLLHREKWTGLHTVLTALNLPVIDTVDGIALLLSWKPQYFKEVLDGTAVAKAQSILCSNAVLSNQTEKVKQLTRQLEITEEAKTAAETFAFSHLSEIGRLQLQLTATEDAKAIAEMLAIARLEEMDVVSKQLERTEQVKAVAERLAHSHLSEVERLQVQLSATEDAKAKAEMLAIARLEELNQLRSQLDLTKISLEQIQNELTMRNAYLEDIKKSKGYKLLTALRLTPNLSSSDV